MRKRIYNWQGQRFGYIWLEGEPGQSLEKQSQGLFDRAGPELASLGLALDKNVVRTRVYGRTRDARNTVSAARGRAFSGQARAATSSFWQQVGSRLSISFSTAPTTSVSSPRPDAFVASTKRPEPVRFLSAALES